MTTREFLQTPGVPVVFNVFLRKGAVKTDKNTQVSVQMQQAVAVDPSENSNPAAWWLNLTQEELPGVRKHTYIFNFSLDRFRKDYAETLGVEITDKDLYACADETVFLQRRVDMAPITAEKLFGVKMALAAVETPNANPFNPNDQPVLNPVTGKLSLVADPLTAEALPFYRHIEPVMGRTDEELEQNLANSSQTIREYFTKISNDEFVWEYAPSVQYRLERESAGATANVGVSGVDLGQED